jgi:hypothetical protein
MIDANYSRCYYPLDAIVPLCKHLERKHYAK